MHSAILVNSGGSNDTWYTFTRQIQKPVQKIATTCQKKKISGWFEDQKGLPVKTNLPRLKDQRIVPLKIRTVSRFYGFSRPNPVQSNDT